MGAAGDRAEGGMVVKAAPAYGRYFRLCLRLRMRVPYMV